MWIRFGHDKSRFSMYVWQIPSLSEHVCMCVCVRGCCWSLRRFGCQRGRANEQKERERGRVGNGLQLNAAGKQPFVLYHWNNNNNNCMRNVSNYILKPHMHTHMHTHTHAYTYTHSGHAHTKPSTELPLHILLTGFDLLTRFSVLIISHSVWS